jgi:hypothetical protein
MDSRTAKKVAAAAEYAARYDTKIKLWQFAAGDQKPAFSFTAVQLEKMTPDQLRIHLGLKTQPKAAKAKSKAKGKAKANGERKPRGAFDPEAKISLLVAENPKRKGSAAHTVYALYKDGMSVADFISAGGNYADLRWDVKHKFVKVA